MVEAFQAVIDFANNNGTMGAVCLLLGGLVWMLLQRNKKLEEELKAERTQKEELMIRRYQDLVEYHKAASDMEDQLKRQSERDAREMQISLREFFERGVTYGKKMRNIRSDDDE